MIIAREFIAVELHARDMLLPLLERFDIKHLLAIFILALLVNQKSC